MTTVAPDRAAAEALRALCWGPTPRQASDLIGYALQTALGSLLELAIKHKVLCLLADHVAATQLNAELPRSLARFFASTLRANRYKTRIYRREAAVIVAAFEHHGITTAALNGISVESRLYGGRGARQFSDLDLLIDPDDRARAFALLTDRGYHTSASGSALTCDVDDVLVPATTLDLATTTQHVHTQAQVRGILARREMYDLPGHDRPLPVLAGPDSLAHCLARLNRPATTRQEHIRWAICADALRLHRSCPPISATTTEPVVHGGWNRLRRIWPQLPSTPFPAHPDGEEPG